MCFQDLSSYSMFFRGEKGPRVSYWFYVMRDNEWGKFAAGVSTCAETAAPFSATGRQNLALDPNLSRPVGTCGIHPLMGWILATSSPVSDSAIQSTVYVIVLRWTAEKEAFNSPVEYQKLDYSMFQLYKKIIEQTETMDVYLDRWYVLLVKYP